MSEDIVLSDGKLHSLKEILQQLKSLANNNGSSSESQEMDHIEEHLISNLISKVKDVIKTLKRNKKLKQKSDKCKRNRAQSNLNKNENSNKLKREIAGGAMNAPSGKCPVDQSVKGLCEKITNGYPSVEPKRVIKFVTGFGCCGFLSHLGKSVLYEKTNKDKADDGIMSGEIARMLELQANIKTMKKNEACRKTKGPVRSGGGTTDTEDTTEFNAGAQNTITKYKETKKKRDILTGNSLTKHVFEKRNQLLSNQAEYEKKLNCLNSELMNAIKLQKLLRLLRQPQGRLDISTNEILLIYAENRHLRNYCARGIRCKQCCPW